MTLTCPGRYKDDTTGRDIPCQWRHDPEGLHHAHDGTRCIMWVTGDAAAINRAFGCAQPPVDEVERRAIQLTAEAEARRERLLNAALGDRLRGEKTTQPAPGPCPIGDCDLDAEGTLDEHLYEHDYNELRPAVVRLALETDRLRAELAAAREPIPVDDLARLLHSADVFANHGDYPSWYDLSDEPGYGKDQVRKAARWLLRRLNINLHKPASKEG